MIVWTFETILDLIRIYKTGYKQKEVKAIMLEIKRHRIERNKAIEFLNKEVLRLSKQRTKLMQRVNVPTQLLAGIESELETIKNFRNRFIDGEFQS